MKMLIIILVAIIGSTSGAFYLSIYSEYGQSMMTHNMSGMRGYVSINNEIAFYKMS